MNRGFTLLEIQLYAACLALLTLLVYPVVSLSFRYYSSTEDQVFQQRQLSYAVGAIEEQLTWAKPDSIHHEPSSLSFLVAAEKDQTDSSGRSVWNRLQNFSVEQRSGVGVLTNSSYQEPSDLEMTKPWSTYLERPGVVKRTVARKIASLSVSRLVTGHQDETTTVTLQLRTDEATGAVASQEVEWTVNLRNASAVRK